MKIKSCELTGAGLDWAVAKCEGLPIRHNPMGFSMLTKEGGYWIWDDFGPIGKRRYELIGRQFSPSTHWSQGGLIIERERIGVTTDVSDDLVRFWRAKAEDTGIAGRPQIGPTPLIAAMRCYVASKLGEEVNIPEELV